jgi:hypothetical protein
VRQVVVWVRDHKLSSAGLVLVVAGCVALVNLSRRVHHLKPRAPASAIVSTAASRSATVTVDGADVAPSGQAGTGRDARSARMRSEFEGTGSYVDFIGQVLSRPQEGGKFYALLAWKRCNDLARHRGVAPTHSGNDAFHDGAVALAGDLEKRCAGVLETYADAQSLYKVAMEQRGGRDFLLPPDGRGIVSPAAPGTADADLDAALKSGDRWAAAEALRNNAGVLDIGNSTGDDGVDRQLREWSAEIVACELVGSCRGGIEASLHCAGTGDCAHDDYREVVLAEVPEARRIIFDTVLAGMHERVGLVAGRTDADARP